MVFRPSSLALRVGVGISEECPQKNGRPFARAGRLIRLSEVIRHHAHRLGPWGAPRESYCGLVFPLL
jgi:hypothetical protein